jgi:ribonuclease M5
MKKINEVIIVEGKNDLSHLKSFIDADVVITGGSSMNKEFWDLLSFYNKSGKNFLVLVDPDSSGEKVRQAISKAYPNAKHVFVEAKECKCKSKVGIEHASKEALLKALDKAITFNNDKKSLSYQELTELGLTGLNSSSLLREKLTAKLGIGYCNAKTLLKRLNGINVDKIMLKQIILEIKS